MSNVITEVEQELKKSDKSLLSVLSSPEFKNSLEQYLPKGISSERLAKVILSDVRKTPKLAQCEKTSFLAAVSQMAALGLEPGVLGYCYLIPFFNKKKNVTECQLIVGYKGLIDLVYRSGKVATIQTNTVDENDEFRFNYGCKPDLYHVPSRQQSGKIIYVYAVVNFKDQSCQFTVMNMVEIEKIKNCSKGLSDFNNPWVSWAEEMMKKTALKRLFKLVPISVELTQAIAVDEKNCTPMDFFDIDSTTPRQELQTKTENLIEELTE